MLRLLSSRRSDLPWYHWKPEEEHATQSQRLIEYLKDIARDLRK